jgi:hypothetical protein
MERHDMRALTVKCLRQIVKYREEGKPETYICNDHTVPHSWDDGSHKTVH